VFLFILIFSQVLHLSLLNIKEEKGESLRAYIDRFGTVALKVKYLDYRSIWHYMVNDLLISLFVDDVCMNPLANMNELRQRTAKFMRVEDTRKYKTQAKAAVTLINAGSGKFYDI